MTSGLLWSCESKRGEDDWGSSGRLLFVKQRWRFLPSVPAMILISFLQPRKQRKRLQQSKRKKRKGRCRWRSIYLGGFRERSMKYDGLLAQCPYLLRFNGDYTDRKRLYCWTIYSHLASQFHSRLQCLCFTLSSSYGQYFKAAEICDWKNVFVSHVGASA